MQTDNAINSDKTTGYPVSMATEDDRELFDLCVKQAVVNIAESGGVRPHVLIVSSKDAGSDIAYMPLDMSSYEAKRQSSNLVRAHSIVRDSVRTAFVSETWIVSFPTPEAAEEYRTWAQTNPSAEFYPGRKEGLLVIVESDAGRLEGQIEIHRAPNNEPYTLDADPASFQRYLPIDSKEWREQMMQGTFNTLFVPTLARNPLIKDAARRFLSNFAVEEELINLKDQPDSEKRPGTN